MANSDKSIFHWVDQYQLMPVWQDYPPPFTAYESYYLERDRQKYYLGSLTDNRDVVFDSHYHNNNNHHHHRINQLPLFPNTEGHCTTTTVITDLKPSALIRDPEFSTTSFLANHHSSSYNSSPTDDHVSIKESPQPKIRLYPNPSSSSSSSRLRLLPSGAPESSSFESASDFSQEENREEESDDVEISEDETTNAKHETTNGTASTSEVYGSLKRRNNYDLSTINEVSQPRKRQRTTPEQLEVLEKVYENEKLPNSDLRKELAVQLGMTPRRVQVWFQNKRAKEKRMTFSK
jgi:hypothetical protein